jgi:hypothetical protein
VVALVCKKSPTGVLMNTNHLHSHKRASQLFRQFADSETDKHRVSVWFYADREQDIYVIASALQRQHIPIHDIQKTPQGDWLCVGVLEQSVEEGAMEQLYQRMSDLASEHNVTFDGWEARLAF